MGFVYADNVGLHDCDALEQLLQQLIPAPPGFLQEMKFFIEVLEIFFHSPLTRRHPFLTRRHPFLRCCHFPGQSSGKLHKNFQGTDSIFHIALILHFPSLRGEIATTIPSAKFHRPIAASC